MERTNRDGPGWGIRVALLLIVALFVGQVIFGIIAIVVLSLVSGEGISSEAQLTTPTRVVIDVAAYLFAGATTLELVRFMAIRQGWPSFRQSVALGPSSIRTITLGVLVALVVALASDALSYLTHHPIVAVQDRAIFADIASGVFFGTFAVLVPPMVEEVIFRGILYASFARVLGGTQAVVLSAVAFGLVHSFSYGLDWYVIALTIVTGLVLGALRSATSSLWPCIAAHATNNAYASLEGLLLPSILGYWP